MKSETKNLREAIDEDGIRAIKTLTNGSDTTIIRYLTDSQNPSGYVQVLEELNKGYVVQKRYTYGLELISQTDISGGTGTQYYGFDGIGSTRQLYDTTGAITDTYDYDAFGNLIYSWDSGAGINNNYLFQGEQYDADLGQYYLRARYMNTSTGRFWTMDDYEGNMNEPRSLHKYLFTANNPLNLNDPMGSDFDLGEIGIAMAIQTIVLSNATVSAGSFFNDNGDPYSEQRITNLINYFTVAAEIYSLDIKVLASLAWSESGWKNNAIPDVGIMQINKKTHSNLADELPEITNISNGAYLLYQDYESARNGIKRGTISNETTIFSMEDYSLENVEDVNFVAVWFYKGFTDPEGFNNANTWYSIYSNWPDSSKQPTVEKIWKQTAGE